MSWWSKHVTKNVSKASKKIAKVVKTSGLDLLKMAAGAGGKSASGGGDASAAQAAPTMSAAAAIESATEDSVQDVKNRLRKAKGKNYTNQTAGSTMDSMKKSLLGE